MKKLLASMLILSVLLACKDKETQQEAFNKTPIMENIADNYIIPHYVELKTRFFALEEAWNTFVLDQTTGNDGD